MSEKQSIWVFIEHTDGHIADVSLELTGKARDLGDQLGYEVVGLLCGHDVDALAQEVIAHGADRVLQADHKELALYRTLPYARVAIEEARKRKPEIFLIGGTPNGRDFAPRVASALRCGLTADCTDLQIGDYYVKKEDKTYKDLLDPKWKGMLGIEAKNQDWFAAVVDINGGGDKGLKYFHDLIAINGVSPRKGHTLLTNMVVSGEVPLALTVYNYMPAQAKDKGAPIDWFALEPAVARSNAVGVARKAPHPAAALLLHEYLLTDAQPIFTSLDYVPTNTKAESPMKGVKIMITDPILTLDEDEKWSKLFDDMIIKRGGR